MSMKHPLLPKGKAMALNLTEEYDMGYNNPYKENPFDYWDQYTKRYAFDIGQQAGRRKQMKMT